MNETGSLRKRLKKALFLDRSIEPDIYRINVQRMVLLLFVMLPLHLFHVIFFWLPLSSGEALPLTVEYQWRTYIILAHALMVVLVLPVGLLAMRLRSKGLESRVCGRLLPAATALLYLVFGATVCVIDQLVTASINPYLIANLGVALAFILHPYFSLAAFSAVYIFFYFAIALTRLDSDLLATIRSNGASAALVGMGLALIIWRGNMATLNQRRLIERQKEELEDKNHQLEHLARTDVMTGLYNRAYLTELVEREADRVNRTGEQSYLLIIDLDHFKQVNDRYGHPRGDTVLQLVAGVIQGQLRSTDTLSRFGGEEFAILLPGTTIDGALNVAEKIRRAIKGCTFTGKLEQVRITASFGLAPLGGGEPASFDRAYRAADKALYRAKKNGRNRVECAG